MSRRNIRDNRGYADVDDRADAGGGARPTDKTSSSSSQQQPMFALQRDDRWRIAGQRIGAIRLAASGGGVMAIATADNQVLLWHPDGDESAEVVEIKGNKPEGGRIHSIFIDPTGKHVLICIVSAGSGTCFHCQWGGGAGGSSSGASSARPTARELPGLRGFVIECIAWSRLKPADDSKTGTFLLGTSNGRIISCKIEDKKEKNVSRLWDTAAGSSGGSGSGDVLPITALRWEQYGPPPQPGGEPSKHFVLAITAKPLRYYEFTGGPTIEAVFQNAVNKPLLFHEIRGGSETSMPATPDLSIHYVAEPPAPPPDARQRLLGAAPVVNASPKPDSAAFLSGVGLYTAKMTLLSGAGGTSSAVISEPRLVPYPAFSNSGLKEGGAAAGAGAGSAASTTTAAVFTPSGLATTQFHYVLLYKQKIVAVSRINNGITFEQALSEDRHGTMKGVVIDTAEGTPAVFSAASGNNSGSAGYRGPGSSAASIYVFSDRALFKVSVADESRDVWKLYLQRDDFESARKWARNDASRMERVYEAEAEHLFATGKLNDAAAAFARTRRPFEETCLRFIQGGHRDALQSYLLLVLDGFKTGTKVLSTGAKAKTGIAAERERATGPQRAILCTWLLEMYLDRLNSLHAPALAQGGQAEQDYNAVAAALRTFLRENEKDIDRRTALSLMSGHGRTSELLFYCRLIGDWSRVVEHHISRGEWKQGLEAINEAPCSTPPSFLVAGQTQAVTIQAGDPNSREELWYRHSSVLMPILPAEVVAGWKICPALDPARLIPTLVRYEQVRAIAKHGIVASAVVAQADYSNITKESIASTLDMAMVYLEWVVNSGVLENVQPPSGNTLGNPQPGDAKLTAAQLAKKGRDARVRAVHDLLLSLYAQQPIEDLLLDYIDDQTSRMPPAPPAGASVATALAAAGTLTPAVALELAERERNRASNPYASEENGEDGGDAADEGPGFDLMYALRVCLGANQKKACVRLYSCMGLYVEAVELALQVDVELAKQAANKPPREETSLRKNLWTKIAVHVVATGGGADGAIGVMADSGGCLKIEDVLAYFPGTTQIGDFKTEVTESLQEADRSIASLRAEMRDYTEAAERIRSDIKALRNRCGAVRVGQRCDLCRDAVLSRHFYLFPCGHAFHGDCLLAEMMRHLNSGQKRRVAELTQSVQRTQALSQALAEGGPGVLSTPSVINELAALDIASETRSSAVDVKVQLSSRGDELQSELDRYVAGECLYCGEVMIRSISDPLGADYNAGADDYASPRHAHGHGKQKGEAAERNALFGERSGGGGSAEGDDGGHMHEEDDEWKI